MIDFISMLLIEDIYNAFNNCVRRELWVKPHTFLIMPPRGGVFVFFRHIDIYITVSRTYNYVG